MPKNEIHIRVGEEIKEQMNRLIRSRLVQSESEIAREGIKEILMRYKEW